MGRRGNLGWSMIIRNRHFYPWFRTKSYAVLYDSWEKSIGTKAWQKTTDLHGTSKPINNSYTHLFFEKYNIIIQPHGNVNGFFSLLFSFHHLCFEAFVILWQERLIVALGSHPRIFWFPWNPFQLCSYDFIHECLVFFRSTWPQSSQPVTDFNQRDTNCQSVCGQ